MDLKSIYGYDEAVDAFVDDWLSDRDYITAHTSGSTGKPKEIHLLKADMVVSAKATCRFFGIDVGSHLVMPLSASYIAGKMMIVRAMVSGARLSVVRPSRDLDSLAAVTETTDLLPIVPSQLDGLLRQPNLDLFKSVLVGGAPLTESQELRIADSGINAYASYGMTETCSHVALRRIGKDDFFTAMPGIGFSVDCDSCLIIDAPHYSQRQFCTNDVVRLLDDHRFVWLGRRDNVINSGGIKIVPEVVEAQLRPFLGDADFYLTSRKSDVWGEELVMVVANHGHALQLDAALKQAASALPHHLLPKAVVQVTEHRYTDSGKLIRDYSGSTAPWMMPRE